MSNIPPTPPFDGPADSFTEPVDYATLPPHDSGTPLYDQVDTTLTPPPTISGGEETTSKKDVVKDQAAEVASTAAAEAKNVAGVAKEKASDVVGEAKTQVKDLFDQSKTTVREQAGAQQERVATGLRSLSDELQSMSDNSGGTGIASDLVAQVASRAGSAASWLDARDPGSLLGEVRTFAQKKPGTFIAIAAIAGVVAGRLTRSATAVAKDDHDATETDITSTSTGSEFAVTPTYVAPVTPTSIPTVPPTASGL